MQSILSTELRLREVQNEFAFDIGWRFDDFDWSLSS